MFSHYKCSCCCFKKSSSKSFMLSHQFHNNNHSTKQWQFPQDIFHDNTSEFHSNNQVLSEHLLPNNEIWFSYNILQTTNTQEWTLGQHKLSAYPPELKSLPSEAKNFCLLNSKYRIPQNSYFPLQYMGEHWETHGVKVSTRALVACHQC